MKKIAIIFITALVLITSILPAIPGTRGRAGQNIVLTCTDPSASSDQMKESAGIILTRLEQYGVNNINISIDENNRALVLSSESTMDMKILLPWIVAKGNVGFHETFTREEVMMSKGFPGGLSSMMVIPDSDEYPGKKSAILGFCHKADIVKVDKYLEEHYVANPGAAIRFAWGATPNSDGLYSLYMLKQTPGLDNSFIVSSEISEGSSGNLSGILISFNKAGASRWAALTARSNGKCVAIVMDDKVLTATTVREEIKGGKCMITGNFSNDELLQLNAVLSSKELPLTFK